MKHKLQMLIAKHLYLAESALARLDGEAHQKELEEVDRLRKELKEYENRNITKRNNKMF